MRGNVSYTYGKIVGNIIYLILIKIYEEDRFVFLYFRMIVTDKLKNYW